MAEEANNRHENILELKNVVQVYKNQKTGKDFVLFENLNIAITDTVGKGQFIVLMGESGCGKSTIGRYFTGLQKPTSGEVLFHGKAIDKNTTIPMVFQMPSALEWFTVLDNIALPLFIKGVSHEEARNRAMEMVKIVGLEGHERKWAKYPLLSGGQLQRVAIARSLVANPSTLVMDEPFSALDTLNRRKMQLFLLNLFWHGEENDLNPTIILVTHDTREAVFLANSIFIMESNPGRIKMQINIDLPNREVAVRNTKQFIDLVAYVEDQMEIYKENNEKIH